MSLYLGPVAQWDSFDKVDKQAEKVIEKAFELLLAVRGGNERAIIEEAADTVEAVAGLLQMYGIRMFENDMDRLFITHIK